MFKIAFTKEEADEYLRGVQVGIVKCQNSGCSSGIQNTSLLGGRYVCPVCWYKEKHAGHALGTEKPFLDHMEFTICRTCWPES